MDESPPEDNHTEGGTAVAGNNEPVTSPDQRKPTNRKVAYTVTIAGIITMIAYLFGNHEGRVEDLWLLFTAGVLAIGLAADWLMVRNGLRE